MEIELAAEKLFALKGFRATSIRDIARAADVNSSMISYYFRSKEQLLTAIFKRVLLSLNRVAFNLTGSHIEEIEKLFHLVDFYTGMILEHGRLVYIFLQEQMLKNCPESVGLLGEFHSRQFSLFSEIIQEGISNGKFREAISIPLVFANLLGTLRFIVIEHHGLTLSEDPVSRKFIQNMMRDANSYLKSLLVMQLIPPACAYNAETCLSFNINTHEI